MSNEFEGLYLIPVKRLGFEGGLFDETSYALVHGEGKLDALGRLRARPGFGRSFDFRDGKVEKYEGPGSRGEGMIVTIIDDERVN